MGAVIGRPDDLSAIYHNPAGLTLTPGTNLLLSTGLSLIESSLRLGPWDASDRYLTEPLDAEGYYPAAAPSRAIAVIPMLTASTSLLRDRLVIAASVYVPNAAGAAVPDESPVRYHLLDSYVVAGNATLAAAFRVTDWLSIGAGVHLIYLRLHARRLLFPVLQGIDLGGILGKRSELVLDGSDLTGGVTLGFMLRPLRSLSFGLALISKNDVALEGDIELRFGSDAITPDKTVPGTHVTTLVIPWTLQGGVNWDVSRFVEVGAELRYYFYREFHEQRTEVKGIGLLSELVTPKNYRDSLQVSGGVKVKLPPLPSLELMAGMHFDRTPAPDETVSAEQPSFNHLGLHTGARFQATRRLRLSFTYARYFYLERRTSGSLTTPPSNFVASGGNNIITLAVEAAVGRLDAR
jgi:long-subunit fatty acid transport protein